MTGSVGILIVESLGWALLHFVWQAAVIAVGLMAFFEAARGKSPNVRYIAGCAALLLMSICFVTTFLWQTNLWRHGGLGPVRVATDSPPAQNNEAAELQATASSAPTVAEPSASPARPLVVYLSSLRSRVSRLRPWLPAMVGLWAAGVVFLSLRMFVNWRLVGRMRSEGRDIQDDAWTQRFAHLRQRLRIRSSARLLSSASATVPFVVGCLKPVILLPAGLLTGLTTAQVEAILAHELAHIRRHDYLVNLLQNGVETFFFYHPAVWWVSEKIRKEREHCCDDIAAAACGMLDYACALNALEQLRGAPNALGVAASGGSLLERIRRLTGAAELNPSRSAWPLTAAALLLSSLVSCALAGAAISGQLRDEVVAPTIGQVADGSRVASEARRGSAPNVSTDLNEHEDAPEYKVGDRIVVIHQHVPVVVDDKTVDEAFMGWIFTVDQIEGSKIWVPSKTPGWIEKRDTVPYASGLEYFNDFLKRNPPNKQALRAKAILLKEDGAVDAAIAVFTEMLDLDPKDDTVWNDLGNAWRRKGDYDRAIANYSEAIRLKVFVSAYFFNRAEAWSKKGNAANAIKDWKAALTVRPKFQWSQRSLAWLLATWPDERFRNGAEAVKRATIACELSGWRDAAALETLAAGYAESGDFALAIEWQTKANGMPQQDDARDEAAARLELYKAGKPYRDVGASIDDPVVP